MSTRNNDPTDGRVYGGDTGLIHIADGNRARMGGDLATVLEVAMRAEALRRGDRSSQEAAMQALCPGCYMVALFHTALTLADRNGQSLTELGRSLGDAFHALADMGVDNDAFLSMESIEVQLDTPEETLKFRLTEVWMGGASWMV